MKFKRIQREFRSALSPISLGMDIRPEFKTYRRNWEHITCLKKRQYLLQRKKVVCLRRPSLGWYPSRSANFYFSDINLNPDKIYLLINPEWNPSIWTNRKYSILYLKVPKDRKEETYKKLSCNGFWYSSSKNRWYTRIRRKWRKDHT